MKRIIAILLAAIAVLSCGNKSVTMNLYYTGTDGNARKFVEEMESSGTADAIRAEEGNLRYEYFFSLKSRHDGPVRADAKLLFLR